MDRQIEAIPHNSSRCDWNIFHIHFLHRVVSRSNPSYYVQSLMHCSSYHEVVEIYPPECIHQNVLTGLTLNDFVPVVLEIFLSKNACLICDGCGVTLPGMFVHASPYPARRLLLPSSAMPNHGKRCFGKVYTVSFPQCFGRFRWYVFPQRGRFVCAAWGWKLTHWSDRVYRFLERKQQMNGKNIRNLYSYHRQKCWKIAEAVSSE